ncbi:MAG: hypothetical protein IJU20_04695 [Clostridia bacterium]|nr:hypothetical protein [Clostridia bacterium]
MYYYFLLFLAVVGIVITFCLGKKYQLILHGTTESVYLRMLAVSVAEFPIFLAIANFKIRFDGYMLILSSILALIALISMLITLAAYSKGNMIIYTMFQMAGGMLLPFVYGIAYGNNLSVWRIIGIVLMVFALIFSVFKELREAFGTGDRKGRIFLLLCVAIFFVNGSTSIVSYIYANGIYAASDYTPETGAFLVVNRIVTIVFSLVGLGLVALMHRGKPKEPSLDSKGNLMSVKRVVGWCLLLFLLMAGVDGVSAYLQLISASAIPAVAIYPIITGGTVVLTGIAGFVFFHEKVTKRAVVSIILTFLSTVLFVFE